LKEWTTSCLDWERRIVAGESLITFPPLFPAEAERGLSVFQSLHLKDVPGCPTYGQVGGQWQFDLVSHIFGSCDPDSGRRLIREFFVMVPKKNDKALALDTPIPTPTGWTTMGEIVPGDVVFGADGKPCNVLSVSDIFTGHDCCRVRFSNGEDVIADTGHLWKTNALADKLGSGQGNHGNSFRNRVRTTQEIQETLFRNDGARNHSMLMPKPLQLPEAQLPIPPYTLGAWLGDGSNRDAVLRKQGLLGNKHIPEQYFRASISQRLALLQGLMDTDGSINKNGRVLTFNGVNKILVVGVSELLSTFGIKNTVTKRNVKCNGKPAGVAYFIQFMAFRDELPVFRLTRKLCRMRVSTERKNARSKTVQIVAAEKTQSVPVKCIVVDSPDHQFLFGKTILPTHNSGMSAAIMMTALILNWRESGEFFIIAPTIEVAGNSFKPACGMIGSDDELKDLMNPQGHIRQITNLNTEATLKIVAAESDTVGGLKGIGILVEELWLFGKRPGATNMFTEATGGLAARPEGFVIWLTTQSDEAPAGVFSDKVEYARGVRDGKIIDPAFLPMIYEFPKNMIERKLHIVPDNFHIVNPNLGASVDEEYLRREFMKSEVEGAHS
jgi:hypothetical protein